MPKKMAIIFSAYIVCNFSLILIGDPQLACFSSVVFIVCGVPWELAHWRSRGEEA